MGGDERCMRRLLGAELRQVQEHDLRRAPRPRGRGSRTGRGGSGGSAKTPRSLPHRLDAPGAGVRDAGDPVVHPAARHGRAGRRRRDRARAATAAARRRRSRGRPRPRRARGGSAGPASSGGAASGEGFRGDPRAEPAARARLDAARRTPRRPAATVHFRTCGSSVSCARVSSRTSPPARSGAAATMPSGAITADRPALAHDQNRITPSLSTASKPKCRASVGDRGARALERGDEVALGPRPQRPETSMRLFGQAGAAAEVAHQRGRARPRRAGRSASARAASYGPSVQTSRELGKERYGRAPRSRRRAVGEPDHAAAVDGGHGLLAGCPTSPRSPRCRPAGWRRRASRGRSTAGSSRTTSGRRRRSAGLVPRSTAGQPASVKTMGFDEGPKPSARRLDAARAIACWFSHQPRRSLKRKTQGLPRRAVGDRRPDLVPCDRPRSHRTSRSPRRRRCCPAGSRGRRWPARPPRRRGARSRRASPRAACSCRCRRSRSPRRPRAGRGGRRRRPSRQPGGARSTRTSRRRS